MTVVSPSMVTCEQCKATESFKAAAVELALWKPPSPLDKLDT